MEVYIQLYNFSHLTHIEYLKWMEIYIFEMDGYSNFGYFKWISTFLLFFQIYTILNVSNRRTRTIYPPPFVIFWIFPHISIIYILLFYQISDFLLFFICTFLLFSHFTHFRQIKVNDMHVFIIHINVYVLFIIFHSCSNFGCFKY